jgi:hypothetical protein
MAKLTKAQQEAKAEAVEQLRKFCPAGTTIFAILRSVSRSGMSRQIDFYAFGPDGDRTYLTGYIASILRWPRAKSGALKVSGCGMDMAFHTVNSLSYAVHGMVDLPEGQRAGYTFRSEWL